METLLAQTLTDWELIICDSYSDDGSWEFFQKFKDDPRIRMFQAPKIGTPGAWNYCVKNAKGKYLYIATSDDTAAPACLERLVTPLERFPALKLAMCDFDAIDERSKPWDRPLQQLQIEFYGEWLKVPSVRDGKTEFLLHACFGPTWHTMTSVLFRRDLVDQIGLFRSDVGSIGDYDWALRASLATDIAFVPGRLATWRVHGKQATCSRFGPEFHRGMLKLLQDVLADPKSGIPAQWKTVPDWEREILSARHRAYLNSFHLWRRMMWDDPAQILRNVREALQWEPGLLARQALRGFAWSDDFQIDLAQRAAELIRLFGAAWPPRLMPQGCEDRAKAAKIP